MYNRKYKDRLFIKIFGHEKENLLSLYNALNGTDHTNTEDMTINTIDDVIYMGMKNDVSCIIDDNMTLIEHQSTVNNNMPLRGFLYFAKLYDQYIVTNEQDVHVAKLIKLPTPQYFVLYNGTQDQPDKQILRLSDAFTHSVKEGVFEWTVIVLNINDGHNEELLTACKLLGEYAKFIATVRKYKDEVNETDKAVSMAVDECIKNNILRKYLLKNKSEVIEVCITEFDQELYERRSREYYMEEGLAEGMARGMAKGMAKGRAEGQIIMLKKLVQKKRITVEEAAEDAGMTVEEFESYK